MRPQTGPCQWVEGRQLVQHVGVSLRLEGLLACAQYKTAHLTAPPLLLQGQTAAAQPAPHLMRRVSRSTRCTAGCRASALASSTTYLTWGKEGKPRARPWSHTTLCTTAPAPCHLTPLASNSATCMVPAGRRSVINPAPAVHTCWQPRTCPPVSLSRPSSMCSPRTCKRSACEGCSLRKRGAQPAAHRDPPAAQQHGNALGLGPCPLTTQQARCPPGKQADVQRTRPCREMRMT